MNYLTQNDFKKQIQVENLNQVISSDPSILDSAVSAALEEVSSYLVQKYDLSAELKNILPFSAALANYKAGDRVSDTNGALYYAIFPQPPFDLYKQYAVGAKVFYKDSVYTCRIATQPMSQEVALQFRDYDNLPFLNVYPDNVNSGVQYWGIGIPYTIPANTSLSDLNYWAPGDTRSQQLVTYAVDIALYHVHSRIAPRNVPDLRVKRYDDAIDWLKKCGRGDVTPAIPVKQPKQGGRIRFGGSIKNINSY